MQKEISGINQKLCFVVLLLWIKFVSDYKIMPLFESEDPDLWGGCAEGGGQDLLLDEHNHN